MKKNRDKYEYHMIEFARFVDANKEHHEALEKYLCAVKGGDGQWDKGALARLKEEGRPPLTDNQLHRNIQLHAGYFLQNAMDIKWEGSNDNLDAPIELANLYHRHIREINMKDFVDLQVYVLGCILEGAWEYFWRVGEDGAKDIGVRPLPILATYRDPHCDELDWGGPRASRLKLAKWATPETIVELWPETEGDLKDELKYIKEHGYAYETKDQHLRGRYGDFYDSWSGMAKVIENWYYTVEKRKVAFDIQTMQEARNVPINNPEALRAFMRIPGNEGRFAITSKKIKTLWRTVIIPALLPGMLVVDEPHEVQVQTAAGDPRLPVVPFSALVVENEKKGFVADAVDLNMLRNKLLTSSVHVAVTNSANNEFIAPEAFIDDFEAQRYEERRALPGQTFKMKLKYFIRQLLPRRQEGPRFDADSHKLREDQVPAIRNVMMTPDVVAGVKEKGDEPLGSFIRRQAAAMTGMAPTNAYWEASQRACADIEWDMMRQLGEEGIERVIESGPDSKVYPGDAEIIVNMRTERGVVNDLGSIPRGKVVVTQVTFTQSQRAELLDMLLQIKELFVEPFEQQVLKKALVENLPLPKEKREELTAALEKGQMAMMAGPPQPGEIGAGEEQVVPPGEEPLPPPPPEEQPAAVGPLYG